MYSLHLLCTAEEVDGISLRLWEAGTLGIQEIEGSDAIKLIAMFEREDLPSVLAEQFREFSCTWEQEDDTDWVRATEESWPARTIGQKLFLAPPWCSEPTPNGRLRIIHRPGMASGTGEHPCTQLALQALEQIVVPGCMVGDIGAGSAILAIAARRLGAQFAVGIDTDDASIQVAKGNAALNSLLIPLAVGSAECLESGSLDIAVANINATVLLALSDDLQRLVKPNGTLILSGFQDIELTTMRDVFSSQTVLQQDGWCALIATCSAAASS
ncbi:MAG TPA: 50S ribosomal protein L11 methyltransferase [Bryobacteraceae bacterium]|jgi:ribosomal protein L11 methyltransferase|nr:50S ribosomal protein L11 methyltransferase [Bryobacteraceae bacterium]